MYKYINMIIYRFYYRPDLNVTLNFIQFIKRGPDVHYLAPRLHEV